MTQHQTPDDVAPMGVDAAGWPLPEVRSMMVENFARSWLRHWLAVTLIFLLSAGLIIFSVWLVTPRWQAEASAMINSQSLPNLSITQDGNIPGGLLDPSTLSTNLIETAKSIAFIEKVVDQLNLEQYFRDQAEKNDLRTRIKRSIAYVAGLKFLRSRSEPNYRLKAIEELRVNWLNVAPLEKSSLIPLLVYGDTPEMAITVADEILELLQVHMNELIRDQIQTNVNYLQSQVSTSEARLLEIEQEITEYRASIKFANPEQYINSLNDAIASLDRELATSQLEIDSAEAAIQQAEADLSTQEAFVNLTREGESDVPTANSTVDRLTIEISQAQSEKASLLTRVSPTSPQIAAINAKIESLERDLMTATQTEIPIRNQETIATQLDQRHLTIFNQWVDAKKARAALLARQAGLQGAINLITDSQRAALQASAQLDSLNRKLRLELERFTDFTGQLRNFEAQLGDVPVFKSLQIIAPARVLNENNPDYPGMLLVVVLAIAVGAFTALVLPVAYDYLSETLLSSRQASAIPGIRVVAVVPAMKASKQYQNVTT